jgi:hypothetical protein
LNEYAEAGMGLNGSISGSKVHEPIRHDAVALAPLATSTDRYNTELLNRPAGNEVTEPKFTLK